MVAGVTHWCLNAGENLPECTQVKIMYEKLSQIYLNFFHGTVFLLTPATTQTSSRGAAALCASTLERLKGFTCSAEPSVGHSDAQRGEKRTEGADSKISERGSSGVSPWDVKDQDSDNKGLQPTEQEREDEEEEAEEKESSVLAATKQVHSM